MTPRKKLTRTGLDCLPPVTDDEALELMVHHLQLAAIYYKNTTDDHTAAVAEMRRLMMQASIPDYIPDELAGALAWIEAMYKFHERLKREQGD